MNAYLLPIARWLAPIALGGATLLGAAGLYHHHHSQSEGPAVAQDGEEVGRGHGRMRHGERDGERGQWPSDLRGERHHGRRAEHGEFRHEGGERRGHGGFGREGRERGEPGDGRERGEPGDGRGDDRRGGRELGDDRGGPRRDFRGGGQDVRNDPRAMQQDHDDDGQ